MQASSIFKVSSQLLQHKCISFQNFLHQPIPRPQVTALVPNIVYELLYGIDSTIS